MKFSRHNVLLTPITVAAGLLLTMATAAAADTRWTQTGVQESGATDRPVWSVAVSPIHPSTLLLATQGHGVLRSSDAGATWTSVISGVDKAWEVRFDPQQAGVAYAGTQTSGLYKSVDDGKTWTPQNQGLTNSDVRAIDISSGVLVVGTADGVFSSSDGASTWHSLGLSNLSIAAVALLPKANGVSIFAGIDNGSAAPGYLMKSEDTAGTWLVVKGNFPGDAVVASLAVGSAPSGGSDQPVIAGTSGGLFRSDDRGATWSPLSGLPTTDFNAVLFNPANPDQIYVGSDGDQGNGGVWRSLDRGATWSTLGAGMPNKPRVTAIALQPTDPAQVIASTWNPTDGSAATYRIADPAAAVAGVTPSAAPATSASARATAPVRLPTLTNRSPRPAVSFPYQTYAAAFAAVLALVGLIVLRRRLMRREDRRTYSS